MKGNAAIQSASGGRPRRFQYRLRSLFMAMLGVSLGCWIGAIITGVAVRRMTPPLIHEYDQLREEIYRRYLQEGELPAPSTLSAAAQQTLSEHKEIQFTPEEGLCYRYDQPYPQNRPFTGFWTLGLWWGGEPGCLQVSEPPTTLIHNAQLRNPAAR